MDTLVILEDVSSTEFMDSPLPHCPLCGGELQPRYWQAGPAAFVAAAVCPACRCLVRANDAFSIEPEPG